jgi:hypothetical protein
LVGGGLVWFAIVDVVHRNATQTLKVPTDLMVGWIDRDCDSSGKMLCHVDVWDDNGHT